MQQHSGEFVITSIAHQQKMCKTAVTDLRYTIHPLPSAQVGHGKRIVQDIHEGKSRTDTSLSRILSTNFISLR